MALSAAPQFNDGRFFAMTVEESSACPIPGPIDDESSFERVFWGRFEKNFATHARAEITGREFQSIGGIPFRIVRGVRSDPSDPERNVYFEGLFTPGNGKIYEMVLVKRGALPEDDSELQSIVQSFGFLEPPHYTWLQPYLHESDNIAGAPLFTVALGILIYLFAIRHREDIPNKRKLNLGVTALCLSSVNAVWIAGLSSTVGIISNFLLIGAFLLLRPIIKEQKNLIARGVVAGPSRKRLKSKFWILLTAFLLGIAIFDFQMMDTMSWQFMIVVDAMTLAMFGIIFWIQRRNFFPPPGSNENPQS